nr:MAG TPA: hypothetical protein [Caudoviricetes sp.]
MIEPKCFIFSLILLKVDYLHKGNKSFCIKINLHSEI